MSRSAQLAALILVAVMLSPWAVGQSAAPSVAVLEFELKDLTLDPNNPTEVARTASLKAMLEQALTARHFRIVPVDSHAQQDADKGAGYLFDHADATAALGRMVGADWVVVGRVHKASFLFVYLKAHVVNVREQSQAADLVVEIKGPQRQLTQRGVDSLAEQIAVAIRH